MKDILSIIKLAAALLAAVLLASCGGGNDTVPPATKEPAVTTEAPVTTEGLHMVHTYGDWEEITAPTLEKAGERVKKCSECESVLKESFTLNSPDMGAEHIVIDAGFDCRIYAEKTADGVKLYAQWEGDKKPAKISFYIDPFGNTELKDRGAFLITTTPAAASLDVKTYASRKFETAATLSGAKGERTDNGIAVFVPYSALGVGKDNCNLAFFPVITVGGTAYTYENPFVVAKYAETWFCLNADNRIYYNDIYRTRYVEDWTRPSYADQDVMRAAAIKDATVEEAIVAMAIAESKGASGFHVHLEYFDEGIITKEDLQRIARSTKLPVLALYYDGTLTQEKRLDGLYLAVESGFAGVDMQGFMGHSGTTATTHTAANVNYWEKKGFDMCFVAAVPAESPITTAAVNYQEKYVKKIHDAGGEVLISAHVSTVFNARQAVAYAEFCAARGVDVVKIVGLGQNVNDVLECMNACKAFGESEKLKGVKVSFHLSGHSSAYISRAICPTFCGSYIYFTYPELTTGQDANQLDLDMVADIYREGIVFDKDITVDEAIARLEKMTSDPQLAKLVKNYKNGPKQEGYIYANTSLIANNWTYTGSTRVAEIRESGNKNQYTTRSYSFDPSVTDPKSVSATVGGSYTAYVSATRQPRVGVYFGNAEKLLAFVYNDSTKRLELCAIKDGWYFGASHADPSKADALFDTGLVKGVAFKANIGSGGKVKLSMEIADSTLKLYAAEGTGELQCVAEIPLAQVEKYLPEDCRAGVISEIYMSSSSAGKKCTVTFSGVSIK